MWYYYVTICIIGYLLGAINFARVICHLKHKDISSMGSGNPGTMNMIRSMGLFWGVLTLILDSLKGAIPTLLGSLLIGPEGMYAGGLSAVTGHVYPIWYKFRGGKGVATAIGVFAVASPITSLCTFPALVLLLIIFKYGSACNLIYLTVLTIEQGLLYHDVLAVSILLFAMWALVWYSHRENLSRLISGKEHKTNLIKPIKRIKTDKNYPKSSAK